MQLDVEAINLGRKLALLSDGDTLPITLLDADGDPTNHPEEAIAFFTAQHAAGAWSGSVADYNGGPLTKH